MSSYVLFTGPLFIGSLFSWGLLGALCLQVYIFSVSFPKERAGIKALVYTLFSLDLLQTGLSTHFVWTVLVTRWGDPTVLDSLPKTSSALPVLTGPISAIVQIFFSWRIWTLRRGHFLSQAISILIVLIALMQCLSAMIGGIRFAINPSVARIRSLTLTLEVEIWLIGSFACDILIAATMIIILMQARREVRWKKTETVLSRLIVNTVESGAIPAVTAGVELFLFLYYGGNFMHETPALVLGRIYSNVVLVTLNRRKKASLGSTFTRSGPPDADESHELAWHNPTSFIPDSTVAVVHVTVDTEEARDSNHSIFSKKPSETR